MTSRCDDPHSALDLSELYSALNNFIEEPLPLELRSVSAMSHLCINSAEGNLNASASKTLIPDLYPIPEPLGINTIIQLDSFAKKIRTDEYFASGFNRNSSEAKIKSINSSNQGTPPEFDLRNINHDFLMLNLKPDNQSKISEKTSAKRIEVSSFKLLRKRGRACSTSFSSGDQSEERGHRSKNKTKLVNSRKDPHQIENQNAKKIKTKQIDPTTPKANQHFKLDHQIKAFQSLRGVLTARTDSSKSSKSLPTHNRCPVSEKAQMMERKGAEAKSTVSTFRESKIQSSKFQIEEVQKNLEEAFSVIFDKQFLPTEISEKLSSNAMLYLKDSLKKKFFFDGSFQTFALRKMRRRTEEHFKFVTKLGFKFMFKNFKKLHNNFIRGQKLLDQLEFYRFYFGKCASETDEPLEKFFLPGSKIQREMFKAAGKAEKTVSLIYLQKIFTSRIFKEEFIEFLTTNFVSEYIKLRAQKLDKLASNFALIRHRNGSKLPWTTKELCEAQEYLTKYITTHFTDSCLTE